MGQLNYGYLVPFVSIVTNPAVGPIGYSSINCHMSFLLTLLLTLYTCHFYWHWAQAYSVQLEFILMDVLINFSGEGLDASVRKENEEHWRACETLNMGLGPCLTSKALQHTCERR